MSMLSIKKLGKSFGTATALAELDLEVEQGSRTAVVGPSGSGKTTLLRLIAGFEAPDTGEIRLAGQLIANGAAGVPAHRRNIGLVMQEGALFPHLSVLDNIRFGIREQRDSSARALALLDLVELDRTMADRQPHQLSGGQQQRVALARALARRPLLMLLDEPFSALDTGLRAQLRQATAHILAEAGVATVLVTHDREEAMDFADQLVVLRQGRLVQAGKPRALYLAPADADTARFLGPALILAAHIHDGLAQCDLGTIAVAGTAQGPDALVLLRPEQVQLLPGDAPAPGPVWSVKALSNAGPFSRLKLERQTVSGKIALELDVPSMAYLQPGGTLKIGVVGPGYALPGKAG
jgi:iron(III) transport system ATP-binding protein